MNLLKTLWSLLFRLFPCPIPLGLQRIGNPGRDSPVLVTCNFHLTVKRLERVLRGLDAWLLVADSKGVNVWCAAGAEEFNTHSVVSAVKTSGIADLVDHRVLVLPPLGAPGIRAVDVHKETGWSVKWGPVRMEDLPRYLSSGMRRDEAMKRATFDLRERLDAGLGSLFPFYFFIGLGFALFGPHLLLDYLVIGALTFVVFYALCPRLPGKNGPAKVLLPEALLGLALAATWFVPALEAGRIRADLVIAMVTFLVYATELGGIASTLPSDLDPFLARLGVNAIGNVAFAGTIRTDLLNGYRRLTCDREACIGCRRCVEICPQGVWRVDEAKKAVLAEPERCTACRACLVQCESGAIRADRVGPLP